MHIQVCMYIIQYIPTYEYILKTKKYHLLTNYTYARTQLLQLRKRSKKVLNTILRFMLFNLRFHYRCGHT